MTGRDQSAAAAGRRSPWPLFLTVHAVVVGRIEERLRQAGLPELAWYDVLWALERAPDHRLRMHELADMVVISRTNITRLVDRLEAARLVVRARASHDRRGAYAVLTAMGRSMRGKMWPVYAQAIEDLFETHLSAAERRVMRDALVRVLRAARADAPKG